MYIILIGVYVYINVDWVILNVIESVNQGYLNFFFFIILLVYSYCRDQIVIIIIDNLLKEISLIVY